MSGSSLSPGQAAYKLSFELCPIILTGGVAGLIPGGMLPIISVTEALNFTEGLLSGGDVLDTDDFFAHFMPLTGSSLIANDIGRYPMANQAVAANAIISQPLTVSLKMVCPAKDGAGYASKLATLLALQATLKQHNNSGGTYIVATPSYFYTNCIMLSMRDVSSSGTKQPQTEWEFNFEQPLLTLDSAQQVQNSLMGRISSGVPIPGTPTWSGLPPTVGVPNSLATPALVPAASGPAGSQTVGVGSGF